MVAADQGGGPLKYILEGVINSVLLRPPIEIVHQADAVHGLGAFQIRFVVDLREEQISRIAFNS